MENQTRNTSFIEKIKAHLFEIILILLVLVSHAYAAFSPANSLVNWYTTDDAYYYFKVAQNVSEGHGFTFDQIGRTNGFHPLWMAICIPIFALARFDLILPLRIVVIVLALLNAGSGILIYRLLKKKISPLISMLAALLWVFFPKIQGVTTTLGMESGINAFFTLLLLLKFFQCTSEQRSNRLQNRNLIGFGIIALFTLLSRLDNIFLILILGIWLLFPGWRIRFLTMGDLVLAVGSVFLAFLSRLGIDLYYFYSSSAVVMAFAGLAIKPIAYYAFGLYKDAGQPFTLKRIARIFLAALAAEGLIAAGMLVMGYAGLFPRFPRLTLFFDLAISFPLVCGWHWLGSRLFKKDVENGSRSPLEGFSFKAWLHWLPDGIRIFTIPFLGLAAYIVWNLVTIGTAMPVSGQIKRWWGTMLTVYGKTATQPLDILGLTSDPDLSSWSLFALPPFSPFDWLAEYSNLSEKAYWGGVLVLSVIYIGLILFLVIKNWHKVAGLASEFGLPPLYVACFLQTANYKMSGYISLHTWYWISEMVLTVIFWSILAEMIYMLAQRRRRGKGVFQVAATLLGIILILNFQNYLMKLTPWSVPQGQEEGYLTGAKGLEENTEPGSLIGSTGGGVLAYFTHGRTIVNMDGLISSYPYFLKLKSGQGAEYLDSIGLNYVYAGEYVLKYSEPYVDMFAGHLKYIKHIAGSALYHYIPTSH